VLKCAVDTHRHWA